MKRKFYILPLLTIFLSCSHKTTTVNDTSVVAGYSKSSVQKEEMTEETPYKPVMETKRPETMMPKATAFRMNGDYADNVAITLGADGQVTYYPAPSDISQASKPTDLGDGWWLNNQGIGANSVFTKYTFEEYSKLQEIPNAEEMKAAVIPGAQVTEMVQLPFTIGQISGKTEEIREYLKNR